MATDVTQGRRAEKSIDYRVDHGIPIGMPTKTRMVRNSHAAKYQWARFVEAVRVVPEDDPQAPAQARIAKQALCPPNPKELERATSTGRSTTPDVP